MQEEQRQLKAMAIIRRPSDGALLVSVGVSPSGEVFHRPLGGSIEFGEYAADAIRREFLEEIAQDLTNVRLAGVLENLFRWGDVAAHEVDFIFTAAFADEAAYEIAEQQILDQSEPSPVIWRAPDDKTPLYPNGLAELAAQAANP